MKDIDLRGLVPAPVTPFTREGAVDHDAIQRLGSWLGSVPGVKGLVVLGHAGEGTFLSQDEQAAVIRSFVKSVDGKIPVIAGITLEGTEVAVEEAKRAVKAGASAHLITHKSLLPYKREFRRRNPSPVADRSRWF
jgi:4-hydroxy-tetrahydrodipicolinate synthase